MEKIILKRKIFEDVQLASVIEFSKIITELENRKTDLNRHTYLLNKYQEINNIASNRMDKASWDLNIAFFIIEHKYDKNILSILKSFGIKNIGYISNYFIDLKMLEKEILNLKLIEDKILVLNFTHIFEIIDTYLNYKIFIEIINLLNTGNVTSENPTYFLNLFYKVKRSAKGGSLESKIILSQFLFGVKNKFNLRINKSTLSNFACNKMEIIFLPMIFNFGCLLYREKMSSYTRVKLLFTLFKSFVPEIRIDLKSDKRTEKEILDNFHNKYFKGTLTKFSKG